MGGRILFFLKFSSRIYILQFHFYKGQLKFKLKGIQKYWFLYIIKKAAKGCKADLLLACKPVQQVAITVDVAILALQACLVSHNRHLTLPMGKLKNFNGLKNLVIISIWTKKFG